VPRAHRRWVLMLVHGSEPAEEHAAEHRPGGRCSQSPPRSGCVHGHQTAVRRALRRL